VVWLFMPLSLVRWYCDFRSDAGSDSSTGRLLFLPFARGLLRCQIENR